MSEDLPSDRQSRHRGRPTGASGCSTVQTTRVAHDRLVKETKRILRRLGFWSVVEALARQPEHHAPVRHRRLRHRPADVGARPVLPLARRRESLRRGRLVLPVVGRRESRADDRRRRRCGWPITSVAHRLSRLDGDTHVRARSFSHVGITVSDFNRAVRFYWDVFGCPLVGVADTPPGSRPHVLRRGRRAADLQDRLDPRARRRDARDLRVPAAAAAGADSLESRRADAHQLQRAEHAEVVRLPGGQGRRVPEQAGAIAARATRSSSRRTSTAT